MPRDVKVNTETGEAYEEKRRNFLQACCTKYLSYYTDLHQRMMVYGDVPMSPHAVAMRKALRELGDLMFEDMMLYRLLNSMDRSLTQLMHGRSVGLIMTLNIAALPWWAERLRAATTILLRLDDLSIAAASGIQSGQQRMVYLDHIPLYDRTVDTFEMPTERHLSSLTHR